MNLADTDIVYIVREGDDNEELRYSLRSVAANLPHRKVIIVGYKPDWVTEVVYLPTNQQAEATNYARAMLNWKAAINSEDVSENFILFNDDFYVMKPLKELPTLHRGSLDEVIKFYENRGGPYVHNMKRTRKILNDMGVTDLKSYALHVPMAMKKRNYKFLLAGLEANEIPVEGIQMRTLYGNLWQVGGEELADVKANRLDDEPDRESTFLSTLDQTFNNGVTGEYVRQQFTEKCRYER